MIDEESKTILKKKFEKEMKRTVDMYVFINDKDQYDKITREIAEELSQLSDKISVKFFTTTSEEADKYKVDAERSPTILIDPENYNIKYTGAPLGLEFKAFIDTIIMVSQDRIDIPSNLVDELKQIKKDILIQVYITPTCPYCPISVENANKMAMVTKKITAECVEATRNMDLATKFNVSGVPQQVINLDINAISVGALPIEQLIKQVIDYDKR